LDSVPKEERVTVRDVDGEEEEAAGCNDDASEATLSEFICKRRALAGLTGDWKAPGVETSDTDEDGGDAGAPGFGDGFGVSFALLRMAGSGTGRESLPTCSVELKFD
jgi:hypothetical protein